MAVQFLSKNGIDSMIAVKTKDTILQIVDFAEMPRKPNAASAEKYKVTISDGFCKLRVVFGNNAANKLQKNEIYQKGILKVNEYINPATNDGKIMIIVVDFDVIYPKIDEIIGEPIEYATYKEQSCMNNQGSSKIPEKYWKSAGSNNSAATNPRPAVSNQPAANRAMPQASNINNQNNNNQRLNQAQNNNSNNNAPNNFHQKGVINNKQGGAQNNNRSAPVKMISESNENFMPFNALTATTDGWRIKGRVLKKSDRRTWKNAKGEGTVFSIDMLDYTGNEIGASFFNDNRFFDMLEEGKVYSFSGGQVKPATSKYSKSEYQITFDDRAVINEMADDLTIATQKFAFTKLDKIPSLPVQQNIDVVAIVLNPGEAVNQTLRSGENKLRRNVILYDDTQFSVEMTLWGDIANTNFQKDSVVAIRDIKVNEYNNNRNLSGSFTTAIVLNTANIPEAKQLNQWRQLNEIREDDLKPISDKGPATVRKTKTLEQVEEEANTLLQSEKDRIWNDVIFSVVYLKMEGTLYYLSCHNEKCNRKIVDSLSNGYKCENCGHLSSEPPKPRYVLSAKIIDHSTAVWVSIGDEAGQIILGRSAQDIKEMKDRGQDQDVLDVGKEAYFKEFKGKIMSKIDSYNGSSTVRHSVSRIFTRDIKKETRDIINEINEYLKL